MKSKPWIGTERYLQFIEQRLDRRIADAKRKIVSAFEKERWILNFNTMQSLIRGGRSINYEAWKELKRDRIIEKTTVGWCLRGRQKLLNREIFMKMLAHNGFSTGRRGQVFGDHTARLQKMKQLKAATKVAEEAQARATAMTDKLVAVARPLLHQMFPPATPAKPSNQQEPRS